MPPQPPPPTSSKSASFKRGFLYDPRCLIHAPSLRRMGGNAQTHFVRFCASCSKSSSEPLHVVANLFAEVPPQILGMAAMREGRFAGDSLVSNELRQGLLHRLHSLRAPGFDIRPELMVVSAANEIANPAG